MRKTEVLIIIPSLAGGGAERVLINLLNQMDYSKYNIILCVAVSRGVYFNEVPAEVKVTVLFRNELIAKLISKLHVKFNIVFFYRWFVRRKLQYMFDVGISFLDCSYTDILFFLADRINKKIAWIHSSYQSYINYYKDYTEQRILWLKTNRYNRLDTIVFVSNDSKNEFINIFGNYRQMEVIYNPLDVLSIHKKATLPHQECFDDELCNIVAMGSLYPVKGYDKLISAAKLLKEDGLRFKVRLIGEGFLRKDLQILIKRLNVESEVELKGFFANPYPLLKASDIFIMTSISEALPTALCEAMILGLPSIVTNCCGCREIVDYGKYGIMVGHSVEEIYQALKKLIIDRTERVYYGLKSLERAKIFNDQEIVKKIYRVMDGK